MADEKIIIGAGGGGGKGGGGAHQMSEEPDSLSSKALATVLDIVSEGEIEGLVDGAKSVFLNDTPLQNADGSFNFQNVTLSTRPGTQAQTYIPGFSAAETEYLGAPILVTAASPAVSTITNLNSNRARVTVGVPVLMQQDTDDGDIHGYSLPLFVDVQPNGGAFTQIVSDTISGKTRNRYQRSYEIPLTGTGPWNVRVRRGNTESVVSNIQDALFFDLLTGIISSKFSYPNSALMGIQVDASQFSSIPTRAYDLKLLRVKIPSNYNPTTRVYTGVWDGTFTVAWTDNPAWAYYDLATNPRYGAGEFLGGTAIDKWSLFTIGQYCDQLVDDGFGGQEPRFTCNVYLQTREEAYKVLNDLASVFRGILYWSSGAVFATQDAPSDPVAIFNQTNVIGDFQYEGSGRKARHTAVVVMYNDKTNRFKLTPEYVPGDPALVARYGVRPLRVVAFGCSSRGQAHRVGRSILYTEQFEPEVVTWKSGADASYLAPGVIVKIADPGRAGKRMGGRIKAATSTSITVDAQVVLPAVTHTLTLIMPDGTLVDRVLTNAPSTTDVFTFTTALPSTDLVGSIWVLAATDLQLQLVRVLALTEDNPLQFTITGLLHNPAKYAAIENGLKIETLTTSQLSLTPTAVTSVTVDQELYIDAATLKVRLVAYWPVSTNAVNYRVMWRPADGNWTDLPLQGQHIAHVDDVTPGDYEVKVYPVNALGLQGLPTTGTATLLGKTAPPADVQNFNAQQNGNVVAFRWSQVADLDLQGYEIRYNDPGQTSWDSATPLTQVTRGTAVTTAAVPPSPDSGPWNLMIKAKDTSGIYSLNAAISPLTVSSTFNVIFSQQHYPDWLGCTLTNMVKHYTGTLVPDSTHLASDDGWETFDQFVPAPFASCSVETGEYDQGFDYSFRVWGDIVSALGPGETVGFPDLSLELDYHLAAGAYDGFSPWTIGTAVFRFAKQRATMNVLNGIAKLDGFKTVYDAEDVTEGGTGTASVGGSTLNFNYHYATPPRVKIDAIGTSARIPVYSNNTNGQTCTVQIFDAAGVDVGGQYSWETTGV